MTEEMLLMVAAVGLCIGLILSLLPLFLGVHYHRRASAAVCFLLVVLGGMIGGVIGAGVMTVIAVLWLLMRGPKARDADDR